MPRLPRLELSRVPLHVTQRVNQGAIFLDPDDHYYFRCVRRRGFRGHGVLTDSRFHLPITPDPVGALSRHIG